MPAANAFSSTDTSTHVLQQVVEKASVTNCAPSSFPQFIASHRVSRVAALLEQDIKQAALRVFVAFYSPSLLVVGVIALIILRISMIQYICIHQDCQGTGSNPLLSTFDKGQSRNTTVTSFRFNSKTNAVSQRSSKLSVSGVL